jgi:N utilization substance protein B
MKRRDDPRHKARVEAMKALFEKGFRPEISFNKDSIASKVFRSRQKLDAIIKKEAPAWPLSQIAPVDLAILRIAVWELVIKKQQEPYKAIVDEAVEIAKEFGSDSSASFINGVLGSIISKEIT